MHNLNGAKQTFDCMLAANPKSAYAHSGLARVAAAQDNPEVEVKELTKAMELDPETESYFEIGLGYSRLQRYDEAVQAFRAHQQINGDDYDTEIALADVYRAKGMTQEAADATQKAAALKPH
jgi:tetratricopeptide (TPR) repeat protein